MSNAQLENKTRIEAGALFKRTMSARTGAVDKEKRTVELAFSSDIELKRWGAIEVLSHEPGAVDMTRMNDGAAVLFNHDWDRHVGVVESARIDPDGKGRAVVRFGSSALAEEKFRDVQDGILRQISVGYKVEEAKLTETREDGIDVYTVTRWQPYEVSFVTVAADTTVGVGRALETPVTAPAKVETNSKQNSPMSAENENKPAVTVTAPAAPDLAVETRKASDTEFERVRSITEIGKKYGQSELAQDFIIERKGVAEFKDAVLAKLTERNEKLANSGKLGLSEKEARQFSFARLARALSFPKEIKFRDEAAFEFDVCNAAASTAHRSVKGHLIPVDVLHAAIDPVAAKQRADVVSIKSGAGYTGTGGSLVATTLLAQSFVDMLRPRTFILRRASTLGGLVGNFNIPKQVTGASGFWVGEDEPVGQNDVDFGLIPMSPKTCGGFADVTRQMLMQPSLDVEALVRLDLAKGLAQTIDKAGLYGSGSTAQPKGLKNYDGINGVNFSNANPTFAELVEMETQIALDNADADGMAYVFNSGLRGYAKTALKFSGIAGTIWEPGNTVNGYGTEVSNQVTSGDVFFGNWSDLWAGFWGGLEINVDPFTHSTRGRIRIIAMQDVDFVVRRPESFTYGKQNS